VVPADRSFPEGAGPVDPDVDLHVEAQRSELGVHPLLLIAAISAGGVLGAEARYALTVAFPDAAGAFPATTFTVNAVGSFAIGVLMVFVLRHAKDLPLLRPFAGVGVLGGFTTFSTYAVGAERLLAGGHLWTALAYLVLTPVVSVGAVSLGAAAAGVRAGRRR
jgi:CrcB protein